MRWFLLDRLIEILGTMLAVSFIVYGVLELDSADVAAKALGQFSTDAQRALWLHRHGYDDPFLWRYLRWLGHFVTGDWGISTHYKAPVWEILPERLIRTGILATSAMLVMVPLSLSLGILAGVKAGKMVDRVVSLTCVATTSIPEFASSVFLSAIFVFWLHALPGASTMTGGFSVRELVLPTMVLVLYSSGYIARITRASMIDVMATPYIRAARMKGASPLRIIFRHALRNALVAPVTVIMLQIPWLLSGVIVVEVFFAYPGFGSLLYEAGLNSDIAIIEACSMVSVITVLATQLASDLIYARLDPRHQFPARRIRIKRPVATAAAEPAE